MLTRGPSTAANRAHAPERFGPYSVYGEIGSGGMATVHLGQLRSASGFTRIVAIKRLYPDLARSPEFVAMFFDEAKVAGRVQHPNVVSALDCVASDGAILLVMDYVHGVSLDQAQRAAARSGPHVPREVASAIVIGALLGLHAAHEAVDDRGANCRIVHRDASPHNILVGVDGVPRVLDFGIAKAAERAQHTRTGEVKGKLAYMAPEQFFGETVGREADVYSMGVVLWELVTGRRLFATDTQAQMVLRLADHRIESPRTIAADIPAALDAIIMKALARAPGDRYRTALDFAIALEQSVPPAPQRVVGDWIATVGRAELARRQELRSELQRGASIRPRSSTATSNEDDEVITSRFQLPAYSRTDRPRAPSAAAERSSRAALIVVSTLLALTTATAASLAWSRFTAPASAPIVSVGATGPKGAAPGAAGQKAETPLPAAAASEPVAAHAGSAFVANSAAEGDASSAAAHAISATTMVHPAQKPPFVPPHPVAAHAPSAAPPAGSASANPATPLDSELQVIGGRE